MNQNTQILSLPQAIADLRAAASPTLRRWMTQHAKALERSMLECWKQTYEDEGEFDSPFAWSYLAVSRPPGYGTCPDGYLVIKEDMDEASHGIVVYPRPLSAAEVKSYGLVYVLSTAEKKQLTQWLKQKMWDELDMGADHPQPYAQGVIESMQDAQTGIDTLKEMAKYWPEAPYDAFDADWKDVLRKVLNHITRIPAQKIPAMIRDGAVFRIATYRKVWLLDHKWLKAYEGQRDWIKDASDGGYQVKMRSGYVHVMQNIFHRVA